MPLATDELVRKATTTASTVSSLIPKLWLPELEYNLRKAEVFQQSIVVDTTLMVPNSGDTAYVPILPDLTELDDLTEGTDMTPYALSQSTSIPLVPAERGKSVEITRKAIDRMKYDAVAAIMDRLAYSVTLKIEGAIAGLWNATTPTVLGAALSTTSIPIQYVCPMTNSNGSITYGAARTTSTITSSDTANDKLLLDGVTALKKLDAMPFPDGYYRWYISPDQYKSLILDPVIRQDLRYASPMAILNNEVGVLHGCRIIVTNFIKTGTENTSVTVYNSLLLSPRWGAIEYKRRPSIVVDPTLYDFGRRRRFGVTADYDIQLIHPERAMVLKSA